MTIETARQAVKLGRNSSRIRQADSVALGLLSEDDGGLNDERWLIPFVTTIPNADARGRRTNPGEWGVKKWVARRVGMKKPVAISKALTPLIAFDHDRRTLKARAEKAIYDAN